MPIMAEDSCLDGSTGPGFPAAPNLGPAPGGGHPADYLSQLPIPRVPRPARDRLVVNREARRVRPHDDCSAPGVHAGADRVTAALFARPVTRSARAAATAAAPSPTAHSASSARPAPYAATKPPSSSRDRTAATVRSYAARSDGAMSRPASSRRAAATPRRRAPRSGSPAVAATSATVSSDSITLRWSPCSRRRARHPGCSTHRWARGFVAADA